MQLLVDNRENTKEYFKTKNYNYVIFRNLLIGDYIINYEGKLVAIIERKTIEDLANSIKDGRYREQKYRLIKNFNKNNIIYIIEGDLNYNNKSYNYNKINKNTIYSTIFNMYLRDNLNVYHSSNINDTINFLEALTSKIFKQGITFLNSKVSEEAVVLNTLKISKKNNITKDIIYKSQLCCIPGISDKYANAIIKKYPNFIDLLELSKLSFEEKFKTLSDLTYVNSKNKSRKLGKTVSSNLIKYLF